MRYAIKRPEGTYVGTSNYTTHDTLEKAQLYHRKGDAQARIKYMQRTWGGVERNPGLTIVGVEVREVPL